MIDHFSTVGRKAMMPSMTNGLVHQVNTLFNFAIAALGQ
jgi:hypothetical protein